MQNVPYPYEVNWQLVKGNGSLAPICSLSQSLTVIETLMRKKSNNSKSDVWRQADQMNHTFDAMQWITKN